MVCDRANLLADRTDDVSSQRSIVEKGNVLRPAHAGHDTQASFRSDIEDVRWWNQVRPHRVDSSGAHQREIATHLVDYGKLVPVAARRKGAIRDTTDEKLFALDA